MARVALVGAGPKASLQIQGGSNGYGAPLRDSAAMHIPNANPAKQSPHRPMITDDIAYQSTVGYTSSSNAISSPEDQPAGNSTVDYTGLEFVLAYAFSIAFDDSTLTTPIQIGTSMSSPYWPPFDLRGHGRACSHP